VNDEHLTAAGVAEQLLEMVRGTSLGAYEGDGAGLVMLGAYLNGFRRFKWISALARLEAGPEALILARSLLSMAARAHYVDEPTGSEERERRFEQFRLKNLRDALDQEEGLLAAGFRDLADLELLAGLKSEIASLNERGLGGFPDDRALFTQHLDLNPFYQGLYRRSSDYMHFSLASAIGEVMGEGEIELDSGKPELALGALALAIITYGMLLQMSQKALGHDLGDRAEELVSRWIREDDTGVVSK
jgi:hypothetical protein